MVRDREFPDERKVVIDPEEADDYPSAYGKGFITLTDGEIEDLAEGKAIAYYTGEYVNIIAKEEADE